MTWMQTGTGRAIDLIAPLVTDIDFAGDVAGPLARTARWAGQTPAGPISTAQHCAVGTQAILRDTGNRELAAAFLLHDAHEAFVTDITRPTAEGIAAIAYQLARDEAGDFAARAVERFTVRALHEIKARLDAAIYPAAGLPWPLPRVVAMAVKDWDDRLLQTERLLHMAPCGRPWGWDHAPPRAVELKPAWTRPWPWPEAADRWLALLHDLCPVTRRTAA
ncbi:hypothetical protein [Oharaeibacter diazotrophicus]|uniref:HD domain-containing protein n=1 Tax=Oharaeibacter diazotrophicus TaxID=1920512 RepID=A0A4R6RGV0_9HYPH|nr:hypothetical protein [Oharaeibacter diazotrophicus]TDP85365.1 hypothetical protein EDD54_2218 [Oharaeibacter diazotrophicus]BBE74335.1 hypothetical protein OHA_1_03966 [Pleomorphomonas sp. SM30]GLS75974.1 hypothetical protein GCM10007904_13090 [Oharaeibacter diazotrophicus]